MIKKHLFAIIFIILFIGFTTYIALDTFVISSNKLVVIDDPNQFWGNDETESPTQRSTESPTISDDPTEEPTEPGPKYEFVIQHDPDDLYYEDENGHFVILIHKYREYDTNIYLAEIFMDSAKYFKTAFAENTFGKNIKNKTSRIAKEHNAIFAINGDYYGARERGYVIRNGVTYRTNINYNKPDVGCILKDGSMAVVSSIDYTIEQVQKMNCWQAFTFGPGLIDNGVIICDKNAAINQEWASNPRTAIAMFEPLHYLFLVSDGRTPDNRGLSIYEIAEFMTKFNVKVAYNLDGGGSSTMVFNGEIINFPTTNGDYLYERNISDIIYVG